LRAIERLSGFQVDTFGGFMKFKRQFFVIWLTAAVGLAFFNWRITVPLNDQGLFMVKDEAGWVGRILIGILLGGGFSGANVALFGLMERYFSRRQNKLQKQAEGPADVPSSP
jgi:hypothetical protein